MKFSGAVNTKHYQPGIHEGNIRSPKHPSQQPRPFAPNTAQDSTRIPAAGNNSTNVNPPTSPTSDLKKGSEPGNARPASDGMDDGGMSTLDKMLTPPESDTELLSKKQDVTVFHGQWQPHIRVEPFFPQPPNPSKERKGSFNRKRNEMNECLKRARKARSNTSHANASDDDGDNEGDVEDNDSPEYYLEAPNMLKSTISTTASHVDPPTTPRRVLRSQVIAHDSDSETPSPRPLAPKPKRKRTNSTADTATPTKGQRVSKRQRKSISNSPLPPMPPVKRTRAEQKKFQAKLDHLVFDPQCPGSVEREAVEVKSGAKEWRKASLHDEPWDGNSKSE